MEAADIRAYAKINLSLDVVSRRPDGYHEVRMIMQEIGLCDEIRIRRKETPGLSLTCSDPSLPTDGRNLMIRAAEAFLKETGITAGFEMELDKHIPAEAGLAGGSADAAAVLKLLDKLCGTGLPPEKLREIGLTVGADVPFCLLGGTALSEGIGEKLTPLLPCPDCGILLAKPAEGAPTGEVYRAFDALENPYHPPVDEGLRALAEGNLERLAASAGNALEDVTKARIPLIGRIEEKMLKFGALSSCMSGSGPTVFGIFRTAREAEEAEGRLKEAFPGIFTAACTPHRH